MIALWLTLVVAWFAQLVDANPVAASTLTKASLQARIGLDLDLEVTSGLILYDTVVTWKFDKALVMRGALKLKNEVFLHFGTSGQYEFLEEESVIFRHINFVQHANSTVSPLNFDSPSANATLLFDNCVFTGGNANTPLISLLELARSKAGMRITFKDCDFDGVSPVLDLASNSLSRPDINIEFIDCEFNSDFQLQKGWVNVDANSYTPNVLFRTSKFKSMTSATSLVSISSNEMTPGSLTLDNCEFSNITSALPVIKSVHTSLIVNGGSFLNTTAGAIDVDAGNAVVSTNLTNLSVTNGGSRAFAVNVAATTAAHVATLTDCSLVHNNGKGALELGSSVRGTISGGRFSHNTGDIGAAIACRQCAGVDIIGPEIAHNVGKSGAVYSNGAGVVTLRDLEIRNNTLVAAAAGTAGVYIIKGQAAQLTNVKFVDNKVPLVGQRSVVSLTAGPSGAVLTNVTFEGSTVLASGANMVFDVDSGGPLTLDNVDASKSLVSSVAAGNAVIVQTGATLRSLSLDTSDAQLTVNSNAALTLMQCREPLTSGATTSTSALASTQGADQGGTVQNNATLQIWRSANCDAFDATTAGSVDVAGTLQLRSDGGEIAFSRELKGSGTLDLRLGGADISKGELDAVDFKAAVSIANLVVSTTFGDHMNMQEAMKPYSLFKFASAPNPLPNASLRTTEGTFSFDKSPATITITISCASNCGGGECVAKDTCKCNDGFMLQSDCTQGGCCIPVPTTRVRTTGPDGATESIGATTTQPQQQQSDNSSTGQANPPTGTAQMMGTPTEDEFPLIPVVAGAAGLVFCIVLIIIIVCVVKSRRAADGGSGGGDNGTQLARQSTAASVEYGALPSDSERIRAATGKEVIAVEWEDDSDEE